MPNHSPRVPHPSIISLHSHIPIRVPALHVPIRVPALLLYLLPPVARSLMCRAVMPSSLHLWATSWAASMAA